MLVHYLVVAALLFCLGLAVALVKKNLIAVLMGLELMLNAANLNLVAFSYYDPALRQGQFFALFVIVVAAAEAALALAIALKLYAHFKAVGLDRVNEMKG
ncbi:MAG: NADH-quinone oxidoreductase subunit NuoK [Bernardetiaceae bacterium]|jgi:NADH-quinone oxidoreductase subunit K|nr:NADH-quinone oxidoreductase subunit NuoK [Bernardetiaceae bacterium]